MIFARIDHGPCYYHWNDIFAGALRVQIKWVNITNISTLNWIPKRKVVQFWGEKENVACNFKLGPLLQNPL